MMHNVEEKERGHFVKRTKHSVTAITSLWPAYLHFALFALFFCWATKKTRDFTSNFWSKVKQQYPLILHSHPSTWCLSHKKKLPTNKLLTVAGPVKNKLLVEGNQLDSAIFFIGLTKTKLNLNHGNALHIHDKKGWPSFIADVNLPQCQILLGMYVGYAKHQGWKGWAWTLMAVLTNSLRTLAPALLTKQPRILLANVDCSSSGFSSAGFSKTDSTCKNETNNYVEMTRICWRYYTPKMRFCYEIMAKLLTFTAAKYAGRFWKSTLKWWRVRKRRLA